MTDSALLSVGGFFVVCIVAGIRVYWLSRREQKRRT